MESSEDEKKTRLGSLKKKAINASSKFRHSMKRGRRNSRVMSVVVVDEHDAEELKAVDALRQALILEELLPSKHDDYHMMLRFDLLKFLLFRYVKINDSMTLSIFHGSLNKICVINFILSLLVYYFAGDNL